MKIITVTGQSSIENVKCFKPISKVFIKAIYDGQFDIKEESDPEVRIRLVDGRAGSSTEIVPEMRLSILSEIASKYEGFQRRASLNLAHSLDGYSLSSVIIGQQLDESTISAVDLSNDKYIDIDLRNLNPKVTYEIWGLESHVINPFVRRYSKFYLSQGEIEKTFSTGENEVLVYPIEEIKELQMYSKNSLASPTFRREELIIDEDGRNDLVTVGLTADNLVRVSKFAGQGEYQFDHLPIQFGYSKWGVMTIVDFDRFDVRREDTHSTLTFLMIDTVPSKPSLVSPSV